jgi:hypothetical protein
MNNEFARFVLSGANGMNHFMEIAKCVPVE